MQTLAQVLGWVIIALVGTILTLIIMVLALAMGLQLIALFYGGAS